MSEQQLKPCPFCGCFATISYMPMQYGEPLQANEAFANVGCSDITCVSQGSYKPTKTAIERWNDRQTKSEG
jgi:hypothetical protein